MTGCFKVLVVSKIDFLDGREVNPGSVQKLGFQSILRLMLRLEDISRFP